MKGKREKCKFNTLSSVACALRKLWAMHASPVKPGNSFLKGKAQYG